MLWHRASREQLAASISRLPLALAAGHPEFQLRRFAPGSGFTVKGKEVSEDFSEQALLDQLVREHVVVAIGGDRYRGPDIELGFNVRSYESPRMPSYRYVPEMRGHPSLEMGGVTFNVHSKTVEIEDVRQAFIAVADALRCVVHGHLNSHSLRSMLSGRELPSPKHDGLPHQTGLLQVFGAELLVQLGVEDRIERYSRVLRSGAVLLELTPSGDFDAARPDHVARLERQLADLPELYPGPMTGLEEEEERPDVQADGRAAFRAAGGQRLRAALVLGYARDGVPVDPGQGPLELHFEGGVVLHSWPVYGDTALRLGPLPEAAAAWVGPEGVSETLALLPLEGAPLGRCRSGGAVAVGGFGSMSPQGWELRFEGQALYTFRRLSGLEAEVALGSGRPDFGVKSENWKLDWFELGTE
jgi:hypothetical protein